MEKDTLKRLHTTHTKFLDMMLFYVDKNVPSEEAKLEYYTKISETFDEVALGSQLTELLRGSSSIQGI